MCRPKTSWANGFHIGYTMAVTANTTGTTVVTLLLDVVKLLIEHGFTMVGIATVVDATSRATVFVFLGHRRRMNACTSLSVGATNILVVALSFVFCTCTFNRHSILDIDMQFITSLIRRIAQLVIQCHSGPLLIAHKCAVGSGLRAIRSRISFASTCGKVDTKSFANDHTRFPYLQTMTTSSKRTETAGAYLEKKWRKLDGVGKQKKQNAMTIKKIKNITKKNKTIHAKMCNVI